MNYKESVKILEEIKKAKSILVNCHRGPDPDSVGSALALYRVLTNLGKTAKVIYPGEELQQNLSFLDGFEKIELVDFSKFDFSKYDLFIALDSSSWYMVSGSKEIPLPKIPIVVIDHHLTNEKYGKINLVDEKVTSTGELLYKVFEDWETRIDNKTASSLLTGIIGDTCIFRYPGTSWSTLDVAGKLMKAGADKDAIVFSLYSSSDIQLVKFWGEVLQRMQLDERYKFVWCAVPYEKYVELQSKQLGRESAAGQFLAIVDGTDFGILMVEDKKDSLSISFRSRTGHDTSRIALALGGGGHIYASGAKVEGMPFDQAVNKVLETARRLANENKS